MSVVAVLAQLLFSWSRWRGIMSVASDITRRQTVGAGGLGILLGLLPSNVESWNREVGPAVS